MSGLYLICKGGAYYRPNAQGYTTNVAEAGRYTLEEAIRHSHPNGPDGPRDGMNYLPDPNPPEAARSGDGVELLPCPFCGEEADFVDGADDDGRWVAVACPGCGAGSRQHYPVMEDARPHAQSAWNIRATVAESASQPTGEVERLREALNKRDAAHSVCPFAKPNPPNPVLACKVCGADSSEPCRKRVLADAEFVDEARAALTASEGERG